MTRSDDHVVKLPYILEPERQPMSGVDFASAVAEALAARLERHFQVEPTLTLDQAAKGLGLSIDLVRQLCKDGEIPHVRVGKFYRIKPIDINNYLAKNYHRGRN